MPEEDFKNEIIARLEDIRALYKRYYPGAFVDGNDHAGYLSCTIFNGSVFFSNANEPGENVPHISGYKSFTE